MDNFLPSSSVTPLLLHSQKSIPPIMSFHMGSLGFLTPFQFYASDSIDTENGTDVQIASRVPAYQAAIEKVIRGKVAIYTQCKYVSFVGTVKPILVTYGPRCGYTLCNKRGGSFTDMQICGVIII